MSLPDYDWCPICERVVLDGAFDEDAGLCVECVLDEEEL